MYAAYQAGTATASVYNNVGWGNLYSYLVKATTDTGLSHRPNHVCVGP